MAASCACIHSPRWVGWFVCGDAGCGCRVWSGSGLRASRGGYHVACPRQGSSLVSPMC